MNLKPEQNSELTEGKRSRCPGAGGLHYGMGGTGEPRWSVLDHERGYKIVTCIHAIAIHTVVSPSGSVADGGY